MHLVFSAEYLAKKKPRGWRTKQNGPFWPKDRERKKHIKKKTRKQNIHGIVPGFWGEFCLCVFSPPKGMTRKKHINKILAPTQSRDNPANLFMFMCFFFSRKEVHFGLSESANRTVAFLIASTSNLVICSVALGSRHAPGKLPEKRKNPQKWFQESPRQTKPKKGAKRKVHEFRPFL